MEKSVLISEVPVRMEGTLVSTCPICPVGAAIISMDLAEIL